MTNREQKPFNEQAAILIETAQDLIKQVLVKHSAAVLEEMHDQIVQRNACISVIKAELEQANKKGHEAVLLAMSHEDASRRSQGSIATLESECNQLNDMTIKQRALIDDLASMCRRLSYSVKRAGNDQLAHQCVVLLKKYDLGGSVLRTHENTSASEAEREGGQNPVVTPTKPPAYRFNNVTCSQCGGEFGPGNHGFSHCENHKHLPRLG